MGTVLDGSYRIEGLLGRGGMGAVYGATHLRLDQRVAIKVMARELAENPEALERFRREARITSGLGHPHIVHVSDFSTTPSGEPYLVMEFLDGEDLDRRLRRVGRLPAVEVVHIVRQVASALAATHAKTIVHRDLKPGNIYLLEVAGESDFVKVLDFGISKVRSASTKLTRTSSIMGTPNYMSPEQARGKIEEIDERTDQWALACIAWECLSGEGPFVGENVPSILFQIVHEPTPSLLPKVAGLNPQVEDVLGRALAKNKTDRFASVSDFAAALEAALTGKAQPHSPTAVASARTVQVPGPVARSTTFSRTAGEVGVQAQEDDGLDQLPKKPKWIWAAVAAGATVLVAGGFLLLRPAPSPKSTAASPPVAQPSPPPPVEPAPKPELPPVPAAQEPIAVPEPVTAPSEPAKDVPKERPRKRDGKRRAAAAAQPESTPPVPVTPAAKSVTAPEPTGKSRKEDKWRVD